MSQHDGNLANQAGSLFRADLNDLAGALLTKNSGASAPGTMYGNMWWVDTTSGTLKRRNNGNTAWVPVATIDATIVVSRSSNTILDISDIGKTIVATASFTQTLDAAATLGDGWWIGYRIESAVVTTFDPNASETIDGSTTKAFTGPDGGFIVCNGSAFFTLSFAAIPDGSVTEVKLASNAVTQAKMADAAVGQAELKNTNGDVSTTSQSGAVITLPGGAYGFYPQLWHGTAGKTSFWGWDVTAGLGKQAASVVGVTPTATIYLASSDAGFSAVARQTYVEASRPYNLGDGAVPLFMFAVIDNGTGAILHTYVAPDPPWANNGPTIINPLGRIVKLAQTTDKFLDAAINTGRRTVYFAKLRAAKALLESTNPEVQKQVRAILKAPISQEEKQRDMPLIPHPFQGNDITGKTVVLLDPVGAICEELRLAMEFGGDSVLEILNGGYLRIGNTPLTRSRPPGVMVVAANWKLT
jgi:hypothetical protein